MHPYWVVTQKPGKAVFTSHLSRINEVLGVLFQLQVYRFIQNVLLKGMKTPIYRYNKKKQLVTGNMYSF